MKPCPQSLRGNGIFQCLYHCGRLGARLCLSDDDTGRHPCGGLSVPIAFASLSSRVAGADSALLGPPPVQGPAI